MRKGKNPEYSFSEEMKKYLEGFSPGESILVSEEEYYGVFKCINDNNKGLVSACAGRKPLVRSKYYRKKSILKDMRIGETSRDESLKC